MPRTSLQDIIRALLTTHHVTSDQLLALLNTDDSVRALKLSKPRLSQILRAMVAKGEIERSRDLATPRFRMPPLRYDCAADGNIAWCIRRDDEHGTIIGHFMTEAEARTCVTALNALDRKVRGIKQS